MSTFDPGQMACIIPCAGEGTRLRPLTLVRSKQLLPVCNRPVVDHVLAAVREAGLRRVGLVVNPQADSLRGYVADGARWGLQVEWIVQDDRRGIGDAVLRAEAFVGGHPFIVYLGDNLFEGGIAPFVERFAAAHPAGLLRLREVEDPRRYGVAVVEAGLVRRVVEKPAEPPSHLAITGLYGLPPTFFDAIRRTRPSDRGELEITDAIAQLLAEPPGVCAEVWSGFWADTGEPTSLLQANRTLLDRLEPDLSGTALPGSTVAGRVAIGEGSVVEESELIGPVLIGRGCRVARSRLGPHVAVGDGVVVEDSRVRESVLDAGATVRGQAAWLEQSILGLRAQVLGSGVDGEPVRTILGDDDTWRTA